MAHRRPKTRRKHTEDGGLTWAPNPVPQGLPGANGLDDTAAANPSVDAFFTPNTGDAFDQQPYSLNHEHTGEPVDFANFTFTAAPMATNSAQTTFDFAEGKSPGPFDGGSVAPDFTSAWSADPSPLGLGVFADTTMPAAFDGQAAFDTSDAQGATFILAKPTAFVDMFAGNHAPDASTQDLARGMLLQIRHPGRIAKRCGLSYTNRQLLRGAR